MKKKPIRTLLSAILVCTALLTACGKGSPGDKVQKVEGLEGYGNIAVITREEGSGTREVFAERLGLIDKKDSNRRDLITADGKIEMNSEGIMEAVKNDKTAVGYVSLGALPQTLDGIKVIKVENIEASGQTVQDGSYPLSREFVLAYSGELSDAEHDFLTYVMSEGQDIVSESYTSVKPAAAFLSDQSKGRIEIAGSTSVTPLMERLSRQYMLLNRNVEMEIKPSDSTSGLTAAMQGSCDLGMSSRELKDYEKELLNYRTIAKDGVAVVVNEDNPVESLTRKQLADIFNGTDTVWNDINK